MLTDKTKKRRRLSLEILCAVGFCFAVSLILYFIITFIGRSVIDGYCFDNNIALDDIELYRIEQNLTRAGFAISAIFFIALFLAIFGEKLAYVRKITDGVHAMQSGDYGTKVQLAGNNELTALAESVNYLSESEQRIKEKEKRLSEEKEAFIRTLSHDIRSPLTSIISYTELLSHKGTVSAEEQEEYLALVGKKAMQIKELTDVLLDGGQRRLEQFNDATLLFEQLAEEFESELEDSFEVSVELAEKSAPSGSFDVGELRRIFDNLISNVQKYANPAEPVSIIISMADDGIVIVQRNGISAAAKSAESHKMGLRSIQRIAQSYGGSVSVSDSEGTFEIVITLLKFD